jgi:hypothetical protein
MLCSAEVFVLIIREQFPCTADKVQLSVCCAGNIVGFATFTEGISRDFSISSFSFRL